jgi:hypothetical protein
MAWEAGAPKAIWTMAVQTAKARRRVNIVSANERKAREVWSLSVCSEPETQDKRLRSDNAEDYVKTTFKNQSR